MKSDDVLVFESVLRGVAQKLRLVVEEVQLALEVLAAQKRRGAAAAGRPEPVGDLVDEGRFAVRWKGRECLLGHTILFRLFRRLASSLNRYVPDEQILDDVWGASRCPSAVRTAVRALRRKLVASGMAELAAAIDGKNEGHYGLLLDDIHRPPGSDRQLTQT